MISASDEGTAAHSVLEICLNKPKGYTADRLIGKVIDTTCERTHAPFAPSASKRWLTCPGSVKLTEKVKGTATNTTGTKVEVTENMTEAVQMAVEYIRGLCSNQSCVLFVEEELYIPATDDIGHIDAAVWNPVTRELHVVDYKHGSGLHVEAEGNSQLMLYALGMIQKLKREKVRTITLHIFQPRCTRREQPFDTWDVTMTQLALFAKTVEASISNANSSKPTFQVSDECRWCVQAACSHFAKHALNSAQMDFAEFTTKAAKLDKPTKDIISNKQLAMVLANLPKLIQWCKAVPEEAQRRLNAGQKIPGWGIGAGRSQRQWKDEKAIILALAKLLPRVRVMSEPSLMGIIAIEKLLPATKREAFMAKHTRTVSGPDKVLPEHKLNSSSAQDDFEDLLE